MGIKKAEIPNARNGRNSENLKDVQEFIESGWDSAEIELNGQMRTVLSARKRQNG